MPDYEIGCFLLLVVAFAAVIEAISGWIGLDRRRSGRVANGALRLLAWNLWVPAGHPSRF
jgi:hypothetical protein